MWPSGFMWLSSFMWPRGFMWLKVAKSGEKRRKVGKNWGKGGEKVAESGEKWRKVEKSGDE